MTSFAFVTKHHDQAHPFPRSFLSEVLDVSLFLIAEVQCTEIQFLLRGPLTKEGVKDAHERS
jgi:hypothetical protein